ncbi:hypothetical protein FQ192_30990 [Pseudomonas sp. ANT_J12]|uniref:Pyocin immunity protein n=1 Tax=Pseudomonas prosekii TaxID=1148509 RepID=A0A2U2D066_9PSED|nr:MULTISPECIES: DUF6392 family protein [Pseudomonas]KAA0982635.1 hypothetical protein FQ192_30990 [Pseudomonas sp. ANT_J12]PWE38602.1 hypothetical protein C9I49_27760 [Pseudomonas prosekii]
MTTKIEDCAKGIGKSHSILVVESVIPNKSLQFQFKGDDEPYMSIEDGLSLGFSEGKILQHVYVTLLKTVEGTKEYKGPLPEPLIKHINQSWVRERFGTPVDSRGPVTLPVLGKKGGWDAYSLDPEVYGSVRMIFQYTESLSVNVIHFKQQ